MAPRIPGYTLTEHKVVTADGQITYSLHLPQADRPGGEPALLLTFSSTRHTSFAEHPYDLPARMFAAAGHAVASFDLPNHGRRLNRFGRGIEGMCAAYLAGVDPFARFVTDGKAVIDDCLNRHVGTNGRIVACGVSRAGYCALRLTAAEPRIQGVAALAPVTDWRRLREFSHVREQPDVAALALHNWTDQLAGRSIYLAIGNYDDRVGTDACVELAQRLYAEENSRATGPSGTEFHVVAAEGHSLGDEWRREGAAFLLRLVR